MISHSFNLVFELAHSADDHDEITDALFNAGCSDALVGLGKPGVVGLDFCRSASDMEEAIASAMSAVKAALPSARFVSASRI